MLLALVLGITLGIVGITLIRQFLDGALLEAQPPAITASDFPHLAPPTRLVVARTARPAMYGSSSRRAA